MKRNSVKIIKKENGHADIILNGQKIFRVLDFNYKKSSAADTTELTLILDVNEIEEIFK